MIQIDNDIHIHVNLWLFTPLHVHCKSTLYWIFLLFSLFCVEFFYFKSLFGDFFVGYKTELRNMRLKGIVALRSNSVAVQAFFLIDFFSEEKIGRFTLGVDRGIYYANLLWWCKLRCNWENEQRGKIPFSGY